MDLLLVREKEFETNEIGGRWERNTVVGRLGGRGGAGSWKISTVYGRTDGAYVNVCGELESIGTGRVSMPDSPIYLFSSFLIRGCYQ